MLFRGVLRNLIELLELLPCPADGIVDITGTMLLDVGMNGNGWGERARRVLLLVGCVEDRPIRAGLLPQ
jgi:hypothetical protein